MNANHEQRTDAPEPDEAEVAREMAILMEEDAHVQALIDEERRYRHAAFLDEYPRDAA